MSVYLNPLRPNPYPVSRGILGALSGLPPGFWLIVMCSVLPCYGILPLGLPTRPVAQPLEYQLQMVTLPLRCHFCASRHEQAIAESALLKKT